MFSFLRLDVSANGQLAALFPFFLTPRIPIVSIGDLSAHGPHASFFRHWTQIVKWTPCHSHIFPKRIRTWTPCCASSLSSLPDSPLFFPGNLSAHGPHASLFFLHSRTPSTNVMFFPGNASAYGHPARFPILCDHPDSSLPGHRLGQLQERAPSQPGGDPKDDRRRRPVPVEFAYFPQAEISAPGKSAPEVHILTCQGFVY